MVRRSRLRFHPYLAALLLCSGCLLLQPQPGDDVPPGGPAWTSADPFVNPFWIATADSTLVGVRIRLHEPESPDVAGGPRPPAVEARTLARATADSLLTRTFGPPADDAPAADFTFPASTLPAPRPGATTTSVTDLSESKPMATPAVNAAGPLRVIASGPRGEISSTSQISISFSRAMVPLSALSEAPVPPVRLSPSPEGEWRWLDPSTLVFEGEQALPKATMYIVEVPADIAAADGERLSEPFEWRFSTPAVSLRDVRADQVGGEGDATIAAVFDQRVDPDSVLPFLRLEAAGEELPVRLLRDAERSEWQPPYALHDVEEDRLVLLRPTPPVPATGEQSIEAVLSVLPGAPSLEGPERTSVETEHRFALAPALHVVEHGCGRSPVCWPGLPWTIRFNQPLWSLPDSASFVRIEPALPGATVEVWYNHLVILGTPSIGESYTVHLDPTVQAFGSLELGPVEPLRFEIRAPLPTLWTPAAPLAVIPTGAPARYAVLAEGMDSVRVTAAAVAPAHWPAAVDRLAVQRWGDATYDDLPVGTNELLRATLPFTTSAIGPDEAVLDLDEALAASGGHLLLNIQPLGDTTVSRQPEGVAPDREPQARRWLRPSSGANQDEQDANAEFYDEPDPFRPRLVWIQRSRLNLDVSRDEASFTVRAAAIDNGEPVEGATLELFRTRRPDGPAELAGRGVTDRNGIAVLKPDRNAGLDEWWIQATHAGFTQIFHSGAPATEDISIPDPYQPGRHTFVLDRPIYAPGDTVRFTGWLRYASGVGREPRAPRPGSAVVFEAYGPRGEQVANGALTLEAGGRVTGDVVLPPGVNAGNGRIHLRLQEPDGSHEIGAMLGFEIEEPRRPNFEVELQADAGPHVVGDTVEAVATARYFTGGGLPDAELEWRISSSSTRYSPPNAGDYRFGQEDVIRWYPGYQGVPPEEHATRTDATGARRLDIALEDIHPRFPRLLSIDATVRDVDRQQRTASNTVLVHPAAVTVGLRTPARFVRAGERVVVEATVVDLEGRAAAGRPVVVQALRQDRVEEDGETVIRPSVLGTCRERSREQPFTCELDDLPAGDYMMTASVEDASGRLSLTELAVRVAGETVPVAARLARDSVQVLTDRDSYVPGDTAVVLVEAPFSTAHGLLTLRRGGILSSQAVRMDDGAAQIRLPIEDSHVPNMQVHVGLSTPGGEALAGATDVSVEPRTRSLTIDVEPDEPRVSPGSRTSVRISVRDVNDRPVPGADVVLRAVDEALLALSQRSDRDPIDEMYPASPPAVRDMSLRPHNVAAFGDALAPAGRTGRGSAAGQIRGVALDASTGASVPDAWVEIAGQGEERGTLTGSDGSYHFDDLPAGEYHLRTTADGYVVRGMGPVEIRPGEGKRVHFPLFTRDHVLFGERASAIAMEEIVAVGGGAELENLSLPPPPAATALRARLAYDAPAAASPVRSEFTPVAAFETRARTDAHGEVEIDVDVPHSLTRYRLRVVAAAGDRRFGAGESTLTARLPLMARATPPRFAHAGDRFDLPVLLENRSGQELEVDVAVRPVNAKLTGPPGRRVSLATDERTEIRFPVAAGDPGGASFQIVAAPAGNGEAVGDALNVEIPVIESWIRESFAAYGELDDDSAAAYPVRLPATTGPHMSQLEVGFSTTAAHGLQDAVSYLVDCWFDALTEVRSSRVLALATLLGVPDLVPEMMLPLLERTVKDDVVWLTRYQLLDGGWSVFPARYDVDPYLTVHATLALLRARDAGIAVPDARLEEALDFLRRLDEHAPAEVVADGDANGPVPPPDEANPSPFAADYPLQARRSVQAFALNVRRLFGDDVAASAIDLVEEAGQNALTAEALAWLLPALSDPSADPLAAEVRQELLGRVVRSAGTAGVVSPYDAGARHVYYSPRRSEAVVLAALLNDGTDDGVVAGLARGLLAHRVKGRWATTHENAFAVLALTSYIAEEEAATPDLVARAWVGDRLAGERAFVGRTDDRHEVDIPLDSVGSPGQEAELVVAREGAGRLYYRVGMTYASPGPHPPVARGFRVDRAYQAVDHPDDVTRDEDGTWRIRLGARVRVQVTVSAVGPRYHVGVIDPLPAGLEALNPALAGNSGAFAPPEEPAMAISGESWFPAEHLNVRPDRYEAFTTRLQPGTSQVSYLALASTPGDFAAPAPRAEEMYSPETHGRGASGRVIVEDRPRK